jgi:hypothetical protein
VRSLRDDADPEQSRRRARKRYDRERTWSFKEAIEDALLLRGTRQFDDLDAYRRFVDEVIGLRNRHNSKRFDVERPRLRAFGASTCWTQRSSGAKAFAKSLLSD